MGHECLLLRPGRWPPFWFDPGLKPATIVYSAALTVAGAAILGVLPALKVTSSHVHTQLRNLGAGASTLQFGKFWTAAMIGQVALTVILLPPAFEVSEEALRDRAIRARFPKEYLAIRLEFDHDGVGTSRADSSRLPATRRYDMYAELERRIANEASVRAVTFADRLPGMDPEVRTAEAEVSPGATPVSIANLWIASVGPRFFETFNAPLVAGRDFHDSDRTADARTVVVNQAFARRFTHGVSPVGRRVRYAGADPAKSEPWLEIVGMVGDIGMTPTDLGEAPYMFTPASVGATSPFMVAVRVAGDPAAFAPRVRTIAANMDSGLRLDEVNSLDEVTWNVDVPLMVGAGAITSVATLGLFLSAAGIFSLMSVSVARRTKEIGLRTALGASRSRLIAGVFSRALILVGCGIAAGSAALVFLMSLIDDVEVADVVDALLMTSGLMLMVGLLACVEPARRALRIQPADALKEA